MAIQFESDKRGGFVYVSTGMPVWNGTTWRMAPPGTHYLPDVGAVVNFCRNLSFIAGPFGNRPSKLLIRHAFGKTWDCYTDMNEWDGVFFAQIVQAAGRRPVFRQFRQQGNLTVDDLKFLVEVMEYLGEYYKEEDQ